MPENLTLLQCALINYRGAFPVLQQTRLGKRKKHRNPYRRIINAFTPCTRLGDQTRFWKLDNN
jgi:hypothetical protein